MTNPVKMISLTGAPVVAAKRGNFSMELGRLHVREVPTQNIAELRRSMADNKIDELIIDGDDGRTYLVYADEILPGNLGRGDRIQISSGNAVVTGKVASIHDEADTRIEELLHGPIPTSVQAVMHAAAWGGLGLGSGLLVGGPGLGALTGFFGATGSIADSRLEERKRSEAVGEGSKLLNGLTRPVE